MSQKNSQKADEEKAIGIYTQKNLFKSIRNQILFKNFRLIYRNQTFISFVPYQSVHGEYNPISV